MNKKSIFVLIGLFGLIGWAVYDNFLSKPSSNDIQQVKEATVVNGEMGLENGNKAPDFQLESLNGETIRLSDLEGKKVILNFWATWCPPCKAEMPHMQDFYDEQKDKNVELLSVNLTTAEKNVKDIETFVHEYELTFPIVLDQEGEIRDLYQAISIPTTYFIDSEGFIRKKVIGPMDKEMMYELVKSMN